MQIVRASTTTSTQLQTTDEKKIPTHFFFTLSFLFIFPFMFFFSHRISQYLHPSCEVFVPIPAVFQSNEKLSTKKRHKHQSTNNGPSPEWSFFSFIFHCCVFFLAFFMDSSFLGFEEKQKMLAS